MNAEQAEAELAHRMHDYTTECVNAGHRLGVAEGRMDGLRRGLIIGLGIGLSIGVVLMLFR